MDFRVEIEVDRGCFQLLDTMRVRIARESPRVDSANQHLLLQLQFERQVPGVWLLQRVCHHLQVLEFEQPTASRGVTFSGSL